MPVTPFNRTQPLVSGHRTVGLGNKVGKSPYITQTDNFTVGSGPMATSGFRKGWKDTDWKLKVAARQNASLAYSARHVELQPGNAQIFASVMKDYTMNTYHKYDVKSNLLIDMSTYFQTALPADLDNIALGRLKSKLAKQSGQVNALIPLVELREMRGLITALALSGVDLVRGLINIKRTKGRAASDFAAHAWLNWSFAVAPTLSDISAINNSIKIFLDKQNIPMYHASGNAFRRSFKDVAFYARLDSTQRNHYGSSVMTDTHVRYKTGFKIPVAAGNNYGILDQLGFELGSLPSAAWELTAFSWLLDYFGTVGDYLDDTFSSPGVLPVYCDRTLKIEQLFILTSKGPIRSEWNSLNGGVLAWSLSGQPGRVKHTYLTRTPFGNTIPARALRFRSVDEIGKNAVNKLLNLGSILVGGKVFSSKVRL